MKSNRPRRSLKHSSSLFVDLLEQRLLLSGDYVYLANTFAGTIGQYTTSGETVNAALISGLDNPASIAISGSELFVVTNSGIGKYTTSGATVNASLITSAYYGQFSGAYIAVSGSELFVAKDGGGVAKYTTSGALLNSALIPGFSALGNPQGLSGVTGMVASGSDLYILHYSSEYYANSGNWIGQYSTSGTAVNPYLVKPKLIQGTDSPLNGIAVYGSNLFVTNKDGSVSQYTTAGATVNDTLISGLPGARAIAVAGSELFVVSYPNDIGTIGKYTTSGGTIDASLVSGFTQTPGPQYIAVTGSFVNPAPLTINGTAGADDIMLEREGTDLLVTLNGVESTQSLASISTITINGGDGDDWILIQTGVPAVSVNGGNGNDSITGGDSPDLLRGDDGSDTLVGVGGGDTLYGGWGGDSMYGGGSADSLLGGLGIDILSGGGNNDTLLGGNGTDGILGDAGNDYIEGRGKADIIYGGDGNDTIYGGAGSDLIYGDLGDDWINVGPSSVFHDTVDAGAGMDTVVADGDDVIEGAESLLS